MKTYRINEIFPHIAELPMPLPKEPPLSGVYMGKDCVLTKLYTQHLMYVSTDDLIVGPHLINLGFTEPHNTRILTSLIQPGDVFVDIGANIGYFSVLGGWRSYPGGSQWAFEPQPALYRLLADNITVNGFGATGHAFCAALSDRATRMPMRIFPGYLATSTMRKMDDAYVAFTEASTGRKSEMIEVQTLRLDDVMRDVPEINVIKIDVEGHEPEVMRGASDILARSRNLKIVMEFFPALMTRAVALDHLKFLRGFGLSIYRIETDGTLSARPDDQALIEGGFSDLLLVRSQPGLENVAAPV